MRRNDRERLEDVLAACTHIEHYLASGPITENLVFDAIRIRLLEIGEAVKDIDPTVLDEESDIPWREIARMRDHLVHRHFDTAHSLVDSTARYDVPRLRDATERLYQRMALDD